MGGRGSKPKQQRIISAAEYAQGWDSERTVTELNDLTANVKGTTLFLHANTKVDMDASFGGIVSAIKYRTFEDFRVWLTPCKPTDDDARNLTFLTDTNTTAQVGFAIPLRKLGIRIPESRTYTFELEKIPVEGGGAVYEMDFKDFKNERRQIDEETNRLIKQAKAEQAKAKREQKRAERLAKVNGAAGGNAGTAGNT